MADEQTSQQHALHKQLAEVTRERNSLFAEIESARERVQASSHDADIFKSRLDEALRKLRDKENLLREQTGLLSSHATTVSRDVVELQERCQSLSDQLRKERDDFLRQEQELIRVSELNRQRAEEDRRERTRLEEEAATYRRDNAERRQSLEQLQVRLQESEETRIERERQIGALEKRLQGAHEENARAKKELELQKLAEKQMIENFRRELAEQRLTADEFQRKLGSESKLRAEFESRLEEEHNSLIRQREELAAREAEVHKREELAHENARRYQTMLLSARHELSSLQVNYERLERSYFQIRDDMRGDRLELLGEMQQLEKKFQQTTERLRESEKLLGIEKRVAGNQTDQLRAQMRNALSLAEREKNTLRADLQRLELEAQQVRARAAGFDDEVARVRGGAELQIEQLQAELERAQQALKKMSTAFEDESRRNRSLEDQVLSLRRLLEDMEQKLLGEQAQARAQQKQAQSELVREREQLTELREELATRTGERDQITLSLQAAREKESSLRAALKSLHGDIAEMRDNITAGSASKAYLREKLEAVEAALEESRHEARREHDRAEELSEQLDRERDNFVAIEQQLRESHHADSTRSEIERNRETAAYKEEIETLRAELAQSAREVAEERVRNQELLQNLLAMRDELEMAQDASTASKAFLKDKLLRAETELHQLQEQFTQEQRRGSELEQQLRELRRKMEFA